MTGDCYVFKFLRRSVDGKHLMRFQSEKLISNFSGVVWMGPQLSHLPPSQPDPWELRWRREMTDISG